MTHPPQTQWISGCDTRRVMSTDLILSSGFLAFGRQTGFLAAVEEAGLEVDALVGTSSGALAGSLWLAGLSSADILTELTASAPLRRVGWHLAPWRGLFTLGPVIEHLRALLPPTFAELSRPLAVGVIDLEGRHRLLTEGDLPAAVAASCAIPTIFVPVCHGEQRYQDGGAVDRVAVDAWRAWRPRRAGILHLVERSRGPATQADLSGLTVVRSPVSGAKLWAMGDVAGRQAESLASAREALGSGAGSHES